MAAVSTEDYQPERTEDFSRLTVRAILFDLDNTLLLTETIAQEVAWNICADEGFFDRAAFPLDKFREHFDGKSFRVIVGELCPGISPVRREDLVRKENRAVTAEFERHGVDGTLDVALMLELAYRQFILAVVSSSEMGRVRASLTGGKIARFFAEDHVFSAESSLPEPDAKPSPAVYQHSLEQLNLPGRECIAVEDSPSGVEAVVGVKDKDLRCIGYVGALPLAEQGRRARLLLNKGAIEVISYLPDLLNYLASPAPDG